VANKHAVSALRTGTLLVAAQLAASCFAAGTMHVLRLARVDGQREDALRWAPVGLLFGLLLWVGMGAVRYATLSTLTVVRNVGPLVLLLGEWLLFGVRPNRGMLLSLLLLLSGVLVYTVEDLRGPAPADSRGVLLVLLDISIVCVDRLLERYLLVLRPVELSTGALVLITNAVGLLPVLLLLAGPCRNELRMPTEGAGLGWAVVTLVLGTLLAYVSVFLGRAVSATCALVVANVDKVAVLGYGVLFMGDHMGQMKTLGCSLALAGGAWHALARGSDAQRDFRPLNSDGEAGGEMREVVGAAHDFGTCSHERPWQL